MFGQNEYLLLTKSHRHEIKISEGNKIKIKPILSDKGSVKGKLEIISDSGIVVGGDSIFVNNIKKIVYRNMASNVTGRTMTGIGLGLTIIGAYALSSITLNDFFQIMAGFLLLGVAEWGIILTTIGIVVLTRGHVYKTNGRNRYSLRVAHDYTITPSSDILVGQQQKH